MGKQRSILSYIGPGPKVPRTFFKFKIFEQSKNKADFDKKMTDNIWDIFKEEGARVGAGNFSPWQSHELFQEQPFCKQCKSCTCEHSEFIDVESFGNDYAIAIDLKKILKVMKNLEHPFFYNDYDIFGKYVVHVRFKSTVNPTCATYGTPIKTFMKDYPIYEFWEKVQARLKMLNDEREAKRKEIKEQKDAQYRLYQMIQKSKYTKTQTKLIYKPKTGVSSYQVVKKSTDRSDQIKSICKKPASKAKVQKEESNSEDSLSDDVLPDFTGKSSPIHSQMEEY